MSSMALVFAATALLCAALALLLLHRGAQRKEQVNTERFITSRVAPAAVAAGVPVGTPAVSPTRRIAPASVFAPQRPSAEDGWGAYVRYARAWAQYAFNNVVSRAGIRNPQVSLSIVAVLVIALCALTWSEGGALGACVMLIVSGVVIYFALSMRASRRRRAIVRQLPSFLDGIVRLVTLGNSVPAAFQATLQTTEAPLRDCLDHVSRMLRTGVEIDRALSQVAQLYGARELDLVGSVLRLSVKYGGRSDVMLDRMATFMRDLEQAERELVAMSSETRLSSWVLGLLPVGIGGFLIVTNPRYFGSMWFDPFGRKILYLAFALQILGAYLLYRLTRLKG
ncbi:type II secretion system F family protein [Paraburkholderia megapolitana]|uniref:Tight adherence protein B n=1 Tax=Paraburkholderia megapolitana TaxID=420953 RepID=A0A1I3R9N9_9BURK|nr:type II secretion system F family protein [Paraburkholderia megapolitana]QDQ83728.1 type II secretion protein F [Paraburkholderia megapolitana]SFJ42057.1 tight adherence protein B [Paraburkholderia megapolitana]